MSVEVCVRRSKNLALMSVHVYVRVYVYICVSITHICSRKYRIIENSAKGEGKMCTFRVKSVGYIPCGLVVRIWHSMPRLGSNLFIEAFF